MSAAGSDFVWLPSLGVWGYLPSSGSTFLSQRSDARTMGEGSQISTSREITFDLRQPSRLLRDLEFGDEKGDPEHICPICLGSIEELKTAQLRWCKHSFCTGCIEEWSKVRRSCPLCKSEFNGWYQYVKGRKQWEEKLLPALVSRPSLDLRSSIGEDYRRSLSDFRFSTAEALQAAESGRPSSAERRSRSQARQERDYVRNTMTFRSRLRLQQLMQSRVSRMYRKSIPLPRQRCFISPAERERLSEEALAERALAWRTSIYRKGLKAVPLSARRRPEAGHYDLEARARAERRLRPWVTRELEAILGPGDHSIIVHFVLSLWSRYRYDDTDGSTSTSISELKRRSIDSRASTAATSELQRFLDDRAALFWHELRCFAECPYTMDTYDSIVVYVKGDRQSQ